MDRKLILLVFSFFLAAEGNAQEKKVVKFSKSITKSDLYNHLLVLTADSLEGRETGEPGQKKAAAYIASEFKRYGLQPIVTDGDEKSYYQPFLLYRSQWKEVYLKAGDSRFDNGESLLYLGSAVAMDEEEAEVVFVGDVNDAGDLLASGKLKDKLVAVNGSDSRMWSSLRRQFANADIRGLLVFGGETDAQFSQAINRYKGSLTSPQLSLNDGMNKGLLLFVVSPSSANIIFNASLETLMAAVDSKDLPQATVAFKAQRDSREIVTENVLGFLEGSDKKDEVLVITSHYDHLGKRGGDIYHGADDDGSGTSAVLEMAQAFSEAKKKGKGPRRSILFMTVTGEEKGLLGSEYYTSNPVLPLAQTVVNLNIDMIGRVDEAHAANENYIYLIGSDKLSQELHQLSEQVNQNYTKLELDYTYNDENDPNRFYYRSDHYNFAKNNVPIIFYFNGVHADYHKPTDTIDKIAFEKMMKVTKLVFFTAWEIANREDRVKLGN